MHSKHLYYLYFLACPGTSKKTLDLNDCIENDLVFIRYRLIIVVCLRICLLALTLDALGRTSLITIDSAPHSKRTLREDNLAC